MSGIRFGDVLYNCFAYADDISLFSSTIPGLQKLIDICAEYAKKWRFTFGTKKSQCMSVGYRPDSFIRQPVWHLDDSDLKTVDKLDILGVSFTANGKFADFTQSRINKCRRSFYSLCNYGMKYPGINVHNKQYMFKAICLPTLLYGADCVNFNNIDKKYLNSTQGGLVKFMCGLGPRSHHTSLLRALNIDKATTSIENQTVSTFRRICNVNSPTRKMYMQQLSSYMLYGHTVPGTMIDRIVGFGISPMNILFDQSKRRHDYTCVDGTADSLRALLYDENFIKPWSDQYILVRLLTRSF